MKNRFFVCLALALLLYLCGCQLAVEKDAADPKGQLVGVLITTQYLDLFDFGAYVEENGLPQNGQLLDVPESRLYAELLPRTLTNSETGAQSTIYEYVFEGIEGIAFYAATVPPMDGQDSYVGSVTDERIEGHFHYITNDAGEGIELSGTVYIVPGAGEHVYYVNPVYQQEDGRVYATTGSGTHADYGGEGASFSTKLEETSTSTVNGQPQTYEATVEVAFEARYGAQSYTLTQFAGDNTVLHSAEYLPDAMPDTISLHPKAAYAVLCAHKISESGGVVEARTLYNAGDDSLTTYCQTSGGILQKQNTTLFWPEKGSNN